MTAMPTVARPKGARIGVQAPLPLTLIVGVAAPAAGVTGLAVRGYDSLFTWRMDTEPARGLRASRRGKEEAKDGYDERIV